MDAFLPYLRMPSENAEAADGLGVTFINYLNGTAGVPPTHIEFTKDQLYDRPPVTLDRYWVLPLGVFTLDESVLRRQGGQTKVDSTPTTSIFASYYQLIQEALGLIPYGVATRTARANYVSWFDPGLGRIFQSGASQSPNDQLKLELLRKFEQTEWEFLARKDEELINKTFFGPWGAFMRDERIAEEGFRNRYATAKARAEAELHSKAKSMARAGVGGGFAALAAAIVMSREVARDQRKIHEKPRD